MPEPLRRVSLCPHCGNDTSHVLRAEHRFGPEHDAERGERGTSDTDGCWFFATCETCEQGLLYYLNELWEEYENDTVEDF